METKDWKSMSPEMRAQYGKKLMADLHSLHSEFTEYVYKFARSFQALMLEAEEKRAAGTSGISDTEDSARLKAALVMGKKKRNGKKEVAKVDEDPFSPDPSSSSNYTSGGFFEERGRIYRWSMSDTLTVTSSAYESDEVVDHTVEVLRELGTVPEKFTKAQSMRIVTKLENSIRDVIKRKNEKEALNRSSEQATLVLQSLSALLSQLSPDEKT